MKLYRIHFATYAENNPNKPLDGFVSYEYATDAVSAREKAKARFNGVGLKVTVCKVELVNKEA